jgi:Fe2+ or Zn2+ uptake regulation protein
MTARSSSSSDPKNVSSKIPQLLRERGLRVTEARTLILGFLMRAHGPFTIEEIHAGIRSRSCNLVTVYRTVASLEDHGLVRRSDFADRLSRFEFASPEHPHHHVVCRKCRRVEAFDAELSSQFLKPIRAAGFTDVAPWVEVFGLCRHCAA